MKRVSQEDIVGLAASIPEVKRAPGEVCLATFWRQDTPGQFYWRCDIPARLLPGQSISIQLEDLQWDDRLDRLHMPRQRGAGIWPFLGDDRRARVAFALQAQGVRTLIDVDDNYTKSPKRWRVGWVDTHEEAMRGPRGYGGYSHEQHRHLARLADGIIVSTPHLANVYEDYNDGIFICPNSVDPADWPPPEKPNDGILRIGFAGSAAHLFDAPLVKKALKWAMRQPDVEAYWLGFPPPAWSGKTIPWTDDLAEYRKSLAVLDVGLCPLQNTDWNNGKSDIKAMEYAMAGVMPVVQDTEPFAPWHDWWDWVVEGDRWLEAVREIVRDRDAVAPAAALAQQYVLRERTIKSNIIRWEEAIFDG